MKKQTITEGAIILITTGFITQIVLGMINQIIVTRLLGEEGMGLYVLILPTLTLLTTFSSMGFSTAIPTLISKSNFNQRRVLIVVFIMGMLSSLIISIILFTVARPFSDTLLRDERAFLPLISIIPLLFCLSLSSILKAYFQSKQNLTPSSIAMVMGQIVRIIASFKFISAMMPHGIIYGVVGVIWGAIASELASIIVLLIIFFKHTHKTYPRTYFKPKALSSQNFKEVIRVSLPTTGNRLVVAIAQFLEPIIVIQCLFKIGYTSELSGKLYSAVSGFTLPILLMPSFISQAITQSVTPAISEAYAHHNFKIIHRHMNTIFQISFLAHGLYTVLVMLFPIEIMNLVFNTSTGSEHLFFMAPFFILFFFQSSLTSILQAIDGANSALISTFISSTIKITLMLILLPIPRINIQGLVIAIIIQTIILTLWQYSLVKNKIHYQANLRSVINGVLIVGITYLFGYYLESTVIFTSRAVLNMLIHMIFISLIYLTLIFISRLFPLSYITDRIRIRLRQR